MTTFEKWGIYMGKGLVMNSEHTVCSETSEYKIQTPGNYQEESIKHSERGENLKSRKHVLVHKQVKRVDLISIFI